MAFKIYTCDFNKNISQLNQMYIKVTDAYEW